MFVATLSVIVGVREEGGMGSLLQKLEMGDDGNIFTFK